jgi:hypothetical protein
MARRGELPFARGLRVFRFPREAVLSLLSTRRGAALVARSPRTRHHEPADRFGEVRS